MTTLRITQSAGFNITEALIKENDTLGSASCQLMALWTLEASREDLGNPWSPTAKGRLEIREDLAWGQSSLGWCPFFPQRPTCHLDHLRTSDQGQNPESWCPADTGMEPIRVTVQPRVLFLLSLNQPLLQNSWILHFPSLSSFFNFFNLMLLRAGSSIFFFFS